MMKPLLSNVKISQVSWREAENYLRAIRTPVFIEEQQVAPDFEWDELDTSAVHLLAMLEDFNSAPQPIACLRIIDYHKIGRMAVLKEYRRLGLGAALLQNAVEICKLHKSKVISLSAQTHAIDFYKQAGFKVVSAEYCDVHIPHVDMQITLD
jgi:predicted GNAT family N-acyltransferase